LASIEVFELKWAGTGPVLGQIAPPWIAETPRPLRQSAPIPAMRGTGCGALGISPCLG